jgi:hypothetical protein
MPVAHLSGRQKRAFCPDVRWPTHRGYLLVGSGLLQQPPVQFDGEPMNHTSQFRVGLEFQLLFVEVMICLGLLEGRLPVLADHDERGQENRFQRDSISVIFGQGSASMKSIQMPNSAA